MRKIILTCLVLSLAISVHAQKFRFGLTASPMFTWFKVDGTSVESDGSRTGFQYGLIFDQTIGSVERYAFSTGLMVNMIGGKLIDRDTAGNALDFITIRSQYIEIPLTIKLRTNEINYLTYYGLFGLTPGINIKARADVTDPNGTVIEEDIDLKDKDATSGEYKAFDINLTVGAGAEYAITETTAINVGVFFQNGFTNVFDDPNSDEKILLKQIGIRVAALF